jgi:hypothetical protein
MTVTLPILGSIDLLAAMAPLNQFRQFFVAVFWFVALRGVIMMVVRVVRGGGGDEE